MKGIEGKKTQAQREGKHRRKTDMGKNNGESKEDRAGEKDSDWKERGCSNSGQEREEGGGGGSHWALPLWGLNLIAMYISSELQWSTRIPDNIS